MSQLSLSPEHRAALLKSGMLDTPPEPEFDRITAFARTVLKVTAALITILDTDRQFFKSQCGLGEPLASARQNALSYSFCQYVTRSGESFVVDDALGHPVVCNNPAVAELNVRAYAGMPLTSRDGHTLGALCAVDTQPRKWTSDELAMLRTLAAQVTTEIHLRECAVEMGSKLIGLRELEEARHNLTQLTVHDLRTPLMSLSMSLDLVHHVGSLNDAQQEALKIARRGTEMLRKLVDELLDIGFFTQAGDAALHYSVCSASEIIHRALDQLRTIANGKGVKLAVVAEAPSLHFDGDEDKVTRVLINLVANSVKFTPAGGSITVCHVADRVALGADRPAIRFIVTDTGVGIAECDQQRIFAYGVKLDESAPIAKSAGLGLTFCQRVAEAHGGLIEVASEKGKGSRFDLVLPVASIARSTGKVLPAKV